MLAPEGSISYRGESYGPIEIRLIGNARSKLVDAPILSDHLDDLMAGHTKSVDLDEGQARSFYEAGSQMAPAFGIADHPWTRLMSALRADFG